MLRKGQLLSRCWAYSELPRLSGTTIPGLNPWLVATRTTTTFFISAFYMTTSRHPLRPSVLYQHQSSPSPMLLRHVLWLLLRRQLPTWLDIRTLQAFSFGAMVAAENAGRWRRWCGGEYTSGSEWREKMRRQKKYWREEESDMSSALPLTTLIYLFSASVRCPRVSCYDRVSLGSPNHFLCRAGSKTRLGAATGGKNGPTPQNQHGDAFEGLE
jgi:hypothetical protein